MARQTVDRCSNFNVILKRELVPLRFKISLPESIPGSPDFSAPLTGDCSNPVRPCFQDTIIRNYTKRDMDPDAEIKFNIDAGLQTCGRWRMTVNVVVKCLFT